MQQSEEKNYGCFEICSYCLTAFIPCMYTKKCYNCKRYFCTMKDCSILKACTNCPLCNKLLLMLKDCPFLPNDRRWLKNASYEDHEIQCGFNGSEMKEILQQRLDDPIMRSIYKRLVDEETSTKELEVSMLEDKDNVKQLWDETKGNKTLYMSFEDPKEAGDPTARELSEETTVHLKAIQEELEESLHRLELGQEKIKEEMNKKDETKAILHEFEQQRELMRKLEYGQEKLQEQICNKEELKGILMEIESQKSTLKNFELGQEKILLGMEKNVDLKALVVELEECKKIMKKTQNRQEASERKNLDANKELEKKMDKMQKKMDECAGEFKRANNKLVKDVKTQVAKIEEQHMVDRMFRMFSKELNSAIHQMNEDYSEEESNSIRISLNYILRVVFYFAILCQTIYLFYSKAVENFTLKADSSLDTMPSKRFISSLSDIFLDVYLIAVMYEAVCSIFIKEGKMIKGRSSDRFYERHAETLGSLLHQSLRYIYLTMFFYDTVCLILPSILAFIVTLLSIVLLYLSIM